MPVQTKPNAHTVLSADLDTRIRNGIISWPDALTIFQDNIRFARHDAWRLNIEPLNHPHLSKMGISHPIDIRHKYLHAFVTLLDGKRQPVMMWHAMPEDPKQPGVPSTMACKGATIRLFAMTPDASEARCQHDDHQIHDSSEALPIYNVAARSSLIGRFVANLAAAEEPYVVPVAIVRHEFMSALLDISTLQTGPRMTRAVKKMHRQFARRALTKLNDDSKLAAKLNKTCEYLLGASGSNSNAGFNALTQLLGHRHTFDPRQAPFIDQPLLERYPDILIDLQITEHAPEAIMSETAVAHRPQGKFTHRLSQTWHELKDTLAPVAHWAFG